MVFCLEPRNWAAIHQRAFDKMDSLDVYVEKRRERYRSHMKTPPKRAAALTASLIGPLQKANEIMNQVALFSHCFASLHVVNYDG